MQDIFDKIAVHSDKALHFSVSASIAFAFRAVAPWPVAMGVSISVGLLKELYDAVRPGGSGFDPGDLLADILGACVGAI